MKTKLISKMNPTSGTEEKHVIEAALFDAHKLPHDENTVAQVALFTVWIGAALFFIIRFRKRSGQGQDIEHTKELVDAEKGTGDADPKLNGPVEAADDTSKSSTAVAPSTASKAPPIPSFDNFLQYVFLFGLIMFFFYLCDYKKVFPILHKEYSRDTFLFLMFLLFSVGCFFTLRPTTDTILGRDQTEEWKGWMQVMFVWYHYFAAGEWYNWIRIYIACYVWMTGFGNFSFFWVKKDFSLWRMLKMLFRLNFLVIFVCFVTKNEYILYYICAMHTYWFFSVYLFMRVLSSWNQDRIKMAVKFGAYIVCNALMFEIPGAVSTVFRPLWFIFQYHDGKHDIMHEWEFRLGLDHWACLVGMLCAYNYPHFEAFMKWIEDNSTTAQEMYRKMAIRLGMVAAAILSLIVWYFTILTKDKYSYNAIHPYTSFIPILSYIVLRNSFPILRKYHVHLFAWLGKITLETYLCQLHIYLQSNAKDLLLFIPESRLLNFSLSTIIYLIASYFLFLITNNFSSFLIPKDVKLVLRYAAIGVAIFGSSVSFAIILKYCNLV